MSDGWRDSDLEQTFEIIAKSIDEVGEQKERPFLAALALALAHKTSGIKDVIDAVAAAKRAVEV